MDIATEVVPTWVSRNYIIGNLMDVDRMVAMIHALLNDGATLSVPSITLAPRPPVPPAS
jgi:hypothetical protein